MERISSTFPVRFTFDITTKPHYPLDYKALSDIEGHLSIFVNEDIIFNEDGILLAELSASLSKWLHDIETNPTAEFFYESMDYEEAPILEFKFEREKFSIGSVWMGSKATEVLRIEREQLIACVQEFVTQFERVVPGISAFYSDR